MLLIFSKITPSPSEVPLIPKIVRTLGCLPLAIEQAASYIHQITRNFASFYEQYQKNHQDILKWVPEDNRPYSYSVATTWSMSFDILKRNYPNSVRLLDLLSFLNADGILIAFLDDGVASLDANLQQIISIPVEMAKALIELERLSLIKQNHSSNSIVIHRLIQTIVRDEMATVDLVANANAVIALCEQAFPLVLTNETRPRCRLYQNQVMEPLQLQYAARERAHLLKSTKLHKT